MRDVLNFKWNPKTLIKSNPVFIGKKRKN
jgi:hypothetical protein